MSVTFGFYNAIEENGVWDREYTAEQLSAIFDGIIADGVYETVGNKFKVAPLSGLTVTVASGRAWFHHTWTLNDAPITVTLAAADASLKRIDAIVIQVDQSSRTNSIVVVQGTPAVSPARPTLTATQHPLAYITLAANQTSITASNITNMVGTSSCPFVTGVVSVMNIDQMIAQWEDQWNSWLTTNQTAFNTDITLLTDEAQTLIDYLETEIQQIEYETGVELKPLLAYNLFITVEDWETYEPVDGTLESSIFSDGYIYRATLPVDEVLPDMRPYVTWDLSTLYEGKAAILNMYQCVYNGVYVYSRNIPNGTLCALTVECRKQ